MRPIRVVQICENPIAGAPISLNNALNKWSGGLIESRHIAMSDRNENRVFEHDLLIHDHLFPEIKRVIEAADVIHLHNFYKNQELFRKWPILWEKVMKKKRVWQAHTQRDIGWMSMEEGLKDTEAKHLVIAQYHPRQYPECTVVQNIVDITRPELLALQRDRKIPRVVYSPSRVRLSGWDNKGYEETLPSLQMLVNIGAISADIIMNVPHKECLLRKQTGDIGIDEIMTGSYHLCSLETLSQGLITIAGLDALQIETLCKVTGSTPEELPWLVAGPKTLHKELYALSKLPREELVKKQKWSREWMEKYWHPKKAIGKFVEVYTDLVK